MSSKKFNPEKLNKLNNRQRLLDIPPAYVQEQLGRKQADVMVDIGAGTAFFSIAMLKQFGSGTVYACDTSQVMLDWITENVVPDHARIQPVLSEEDAIPLEDDIADIVFMMNLHHELDAPAKIVRESYRLLKPGGSVFIVDWKKTRMAEGPPEKIRCLPEQVADQLADGGYDDISIHLELPKHFLITGRKASARESS